MHLVSFRIGVAVAAVLVPAAVAAAPEHLLVPHRATYDLSLARAEPSVSITSATGRLIFELSGSWCEGYTVTSSFLTNTVDGEGEVQSSDLRTSAYETLDPAEYHFLNQTFVGNEAQAVIDGVARVTPEGTSVEISQPKEGSLSLGRAVFPTQHTHLILDAAAAGEKVLEAPVFDGSGTADKVYDTTTVIGPAKPGLPDASGSELQALGVVDGAAEMPTHSVLISYFAQDNSPGESMPDYVISFRMMMNGIAYNATFDYGTFVLRGRLIDLEVSDVPQCPAPGADGAPAAGSE